MEREKDFILLRASGVSGAELLRLITLENLIIGIIGSGIGIYFRMSFTTYMLDVMSQIFFPIRLFIPEIILVTIFSISIITILLSQIPAFRSIVNSNIAEATRAKGG